MSMLNDENSSTSGISTRLDRLEQRIEDEGSRSLTFADLINVVVAEVEGQQRLGAEGQFVTQNRHLVVAEVQVLQLVRNPLATGE